MKLLKLIDQYLEEVLLTLMLLVISIVMVAQVISRYVFNASLSWSDELARYLLVWSCFLSVSFCVKKRISIKIEQLQNALPKEWISWLRLFRHSIVLVFCLIMLPYAFLYLQQTIRSGASSAAMRLPMYWIQSAPLVGFLLLTLRVVQAWVREFRISVLHYPDPKRQDEHEGKPAHFPKSDEPGEIWVETQLTAEEEYRSRESLGTLRRENVSEETNKTAGGDET